MNFNTQIFKTSLFKITSLNSVSVVLKIITGLISSKVIAVFLGAPGMALVGNMRNFFTSVETISTLGFQNGIVKYSAENQENKEGLKKVLSTVFFTLVFASILFGFVLFVFASQWDKEVFGQNSSYDFVFKILALTLPFYVLNLFIISIINGFGKFKPVIFINIFGNIIGLLVSIVLIYNYNVSGALISIVVIPALLFFLSLYYGSKEFSFKENISWTSFDFSIIKNLSSYSIMALVYGFIGPLVYLAIRNNVIEKLDLEQAGFWSAMERISSNYLLFITTLLSVYFLPKLVLAKDNQETKKVFWSYFKTIIPIFVFGLILIYFSRFLIVKILFTQEMMPVSNLFFWQLVGDVFKAISLILGYQFFAKKMTKAFVITEICSLAILYFSSIYFVEVFQIEGIVMAHALTYSIYLVVLSIYFRKSLF